MPEIIVDYHPTPKQAMFHSTNANEVLYGGAAAGGKSTCMAMEAFKLCMTYPGLQAWMFRRTYKELESSLIQEALKFYSSVGRYVRSSHEWYLPNGSIIRFRHCQHEADKYLYQGAEINALFVDELTHFTRSIVDYLSTRVRVRKGIVDKDGRPFRPRKRFASNPGGVGHAWVKQSYADLEPFTKHKFEVESKVLGRAEIVTRQYIPARVTDNPYIGDEYIIELEQKPERLRRALLEGRWDVFEGQVFYEFIDDMDGYRTHKHTHVIEPIAELPRFWTRYRSFDFGYTKPFAVLWWATDQDGRCYLYREWYGASAADVGIKLTPAQIAQGIIDRERDDGSVIGYADPAIWEHTSGDSIAEQMAAAGVYWNKGDNARFAGKMQLHNRLRFDEKGIPMLYVFRSCPNFIRTIPALVYSDINVEDVDTKSEDHIYDATRYFLMSHPIASPAPIERQIPEYNPLAPDVHRPSGFLSL